MQEAFRQAMENNPKSPIVRVLRGVNQNQARERNRQREEDLFVQLREKYNSLGRMWYETKINQFADTHNRHNLIPIEQKRKQWTQALATLKDKSSEKRIELLTAMASGMQLTADYAPRVYKQSILQTVFNNPLGFSTGKLLGKNFTPQSIIFMEAISDMSGHSEEQKQEFREFMIKDAGLTGKVGLPQLFPDISRWIDHAK